LISEKLGRSLEGVQPMIPGWTALTVCGGSGMDAEFLARAGCRVISSDISLGAARRARERARRYGFQLLPIVADVECLPFEDRSVDLVYVHDGLHHLTSPLAGLNEMARVARRAVSITEPARALATRVAIHVGVADEVEDAGNTVARLTPRDACAALRDLGFVILKSKRYAMYYPHEPGEGFRRLSQPALFGLVKTGWRLLNATLGPHIGNKLSIVAIPEGPLELSQPDSWAARPGLLAHP
jgi:SAM-dependent methyltransferase